LIDDLKPGRLPLPASGPLKRQHRARRNGRPLQSDRPQNSGDWLEPIALTAIGSARRSGKSAPTSASPNVDTQ
jgi:hypothetical protein